MAFETGIAVSHTDFLSQLGVFAAANAGFTNHGVTVFEESEGDLNTLRLSKGGIYYAFQADHEYTRYDFTAKQIRFVMGYSQFVESIREQGTTGDAVSYFSSLDTYELSGPFLGHWFYAHEDSVFAVLQIYSNTYMHLSFGKIKKYGVWEGGEYITGNSVVYSRGSSNGEFSFSTNMAVIFAETFDGITANGYSGYVRIGNENLNYLDFLRMGDDVLCGNPETGAHNTTVFKSAYFLRDLVATSPNDFNLRSVLVPALVKVSANLNGGDPLWIAGEIPGFRWVNNKNIPDESIVDTEWQVFSLSSKTSDNSSSANSGQVGVAYRVT